MKKISALIFGVVCLSIAVLFYWHDNQSDRVAFFLTCITPIGTISAVLFALYGDFLRAKLDPLRLEIDVPDESNKVIDENKIEGIKRYIYVHHLVVKNLTPHKKVENCRVLLKSIYQKDANGVWHDEPKFAVPRYMEWAPSEFSRRKRTFCKIQTFDLGRTYDKDWGFFAAYDRDQGGNVPRQFKVNKTIRFKFYVTADNYSEEREFIFEIKILPSNPISK